MKNLDYLFSDDVIDADFELFSLGRACGHRLGQAYYNSLGETEKNLLRGRGEDPYYDDDKSSVIRAHNFLRTAMKLGVS